MPSILYCSKTLVFKFSVKTFRVLQLKRIAIKDRYSNLRTTKYLQKLKLLWSTRIMIEQNDNNVINCTQQLHIVSGIYTRSSKF